jgi:hypothetical protein
VILFGVLGVVATLLMLIVSGFIGCIRLPFRIAKQIAAEYPKETARMVIGVLSAGIVAYLLDAPYVVQISFGGGIIGVIIGKILKWKS